MQLGHHLLCIYQLVRPPLTHAVCVDVPSILLSVAMAQSAVTMCSERVCGSVWTRLGLHLSLRVEQCIRSGLCVGLELGPGPDHTGWA